MSNRTRLLKLLKLLQENTDENHAMATSDIIATLTNDGEKCERKVIYSDIKALNEAGYSIESSKSGENKGFYYSGFLFENPELRVMIDGIRANNFINKKKSEAMVNNLLSLTNKYNREIIKTTLAPMDNKSENNAVIYNIDRIQNALYYRKWISFRYMDVDIKGKKIYRKEGKVRIFCPKALSWNDDRYYVVGYHENNDHPYPYRIDRMDSIEIIEDMPYDDKPFDIGEYQRTHSKMFGGETVGITLGSNQVSLASEIRDQFGDGFILTRNDDGYFEEHVNV